MNTPDITTYQAAMLQSRVHRAIKTQLAKQLKAHGLTMMQWSIIGLVADAGKDGVRISDLARLFDTSLAFITTSVNVLEAKGLVTRVGHAHDSRAKLVQLEPAFASEVAAIEKELQAMQGGNLFKDVSTKDMAAYFRVLQRISKTA